jgi:hypothetical protein
VPGATRFVALNNPTSPNLQSVIAEAQAAARSLGLQLLVLNASTERDFEQAFVILVGPLVTDAVEKVVGSIVALQPAQWFPRRPPRSDLRAHVEDFHFQMAQPSRRLSGRVTELLRPENSGVRDNIILERWTSSLPNLGRLQPETVRSCPNF